MPDENAPAAPTPGTQAPEEQTQAMTIPDASHDGRTSTARRWIAGATAGALVVAGALLWGGRTPAQAAYVTSVASRGSIEQRFTTGGIVERDNQVELDFATPSLVTAIEVNLGDTVQAGQTLALVDPAALRLSVLQARASVAQAEAQLDADLDAQEAGESASAVTLPTAGTAGSSGSAGVTGTTGASGSAAGTASPGATQTPEYMVALTESLAAVQVLVVAEQTACQPVFAAGQALTQLGIGLPSTLPTALPTSLPTTLPTSLAAGVPTLPAAANIAETDDTAPREVAASEPVEVAPPAESSTEQTGTPASATTPDGEAPEPCSLEHPDCFPSSHPSGLPTTLPPLPTAHPSGLPTTLPTALPTALPTLPTSELAALLGQVQACSAAMVALAQAEIQAGAALGVAAQGLAEANAAAAAALQQAQAELQAAAAAASEQAIKAAQQQLEAQLASRLGGAVTDATIASDRARLLQARQELARAESDLAGATLTTPVSGTVGAISLRRGESSAGRSVTIVGAGSATVTIDVPLTVRSFVNPGMAADVGMVGGELALPGRVDSVAILADSPGASPTYRTTVVTDDPEQLLKSGSRAEVSLRLKTAQDVLTVPMSAVTKVTDTTATVQVVAGDRATESEQVTVVTGIQGGGRIEIVSGLASGQLVVLADRRLPVPGGFQQYQSLGRSTSSPTPTAGR